MVIISGKNNVTASLFGRLYYIKRRDIAAELIRKLNISACTHRQTDNRIEDVYRWEPPGS